MKGAFPRKSRLSDNNTFPLAFAISAHFQVGILELFLATSFDPLDSYCIHVDAKADEKVTKAVDQMVKCYEWKHPKATIFTVDDPISVFWGHFSVLEADLKCMQLLRTRNAHWNLLINPAGTELPLKPMPEIRKHLEKFPNGIVDSFPLPEDSKGRFSFSHELKNVGIGQVHMKITQTDKVKKLPPGNIVLRKGSKNVALSREVLDFFLDDPFSQIFLEWLQDTAVPDEHFYSTIITLFNNGTRDLDNVSLYKGCVRLSWWFDHNCKGKNVREICNFGLEDLPRLHQNEYCLFANKFNLDVDPIAPMEHALYLLNV
ncbi:beta-1,3-galactosyl-O-glycosyl-glycoprotein beta-1,6-N-acetylglucosaminyltransferase 4-like [Tigriopus californicus]|uniref:beta-1,3-galactosyl-O-glycosyl-glycoprotein beta-1,6-N-acetylglucosaminyltransferase 4-like n=1 Tax=Tigriopus californicus TaxID=6832 RepID=UPI0027DA4923|nr:beta-1,3-galactosyl-O-glycosyl-glycoprotein beta-1,6-N-acetylglucosaminyltransferase 4-like [Tigriopus californicus]